MEPDLMLVVEMFLSYYTYVLIYKNISLQFSCVKKLHKSEMFYPLFFFKLP